MRTPHPTLTRLLLLALSLCGFHPADAHANPTRSDQGPAFFADSTVLHGPTSAVIPFRVPVADANRDRTFRAQVTGPLQIIGPPEVLAKHTTGFIRVRPKPGLDRPATATLTLNGQTLQVRLLPAPRDPDANRYRPSLTTPVQHAAIWGTITAQVEWRTNPDQPHLARAQPLLRIDSGRTLKPLTTSQFQSAPTRQAVFQIDTEQLAPGHVRLTPLLQHPGSNRPDTVGTAVVIRVVRPDDADLLIREAEAPNTQDQPIPERYPQHPPNTADDDTASGGRYVVHHGSRPVQTHPLEIETAGWYQLIVRARGTPAAAVLPTVGLRIDNQRDARTQAQIAHTDWHRAVVGQPVYLTPELRTLIPYFENDYARGSNNDRNLHLDRIELARLDPPPDAIAARGPRSVPAPEQLSVAFTQTWHGRHTTGDLVLNAHTHLHKNHAGTLPTVQLRLNGSTVAEQTDRRPRFKIPHAMLQPGANTLQLVARHPDLGIAAGPTHTVQAHTLPSPQTEPIKPQPDARFALTDPRWDEPAQHRDRHAGKQPVRALMSNGLATLNLPPKLEGRFHLFLDARGDHHNGPPLAQASLRHAGQDRAIAKPVPVNTRYHTQRVGPVTLQRGPKQLSIAFTNDLYDPKTKKDRNLFIRSIELRPVRSPDTTAPTGTLLYPQPDALLAVADAVVVQAAEDRALRSAEVLLNGQPTGLLFEVSHSHARHLLPLPLRHIPDGTHTLAVRLTDHAGNTTDTDPVRVCTQIAPADQPTTYQRALHLLNRFAFGPDPQQLTELLVLGPDRYLEQQLLHDQTPADHTVTRNAARARFPDFDNSYHVTMRGLAAPLASRQPVRHRFTLFVNNHFNTWARKTGAGLKALEAGHFDTLGAAPFTQLLLASAKSPAMIIYLDQQNSSGRRINENYARELMELHTVGVHAGYSQQDVTRLAQLLTGWTVASYGRSVKNAFRYDPLQAQNAGQRVFGLRLDDAAAPQRYDRARHAILMLARHPATARFIATKLAEHYTQTPADPQLIDHLTHTFHTTGGDTARMLIALAQHPAFDHAIQHPRLAQPFPYALGLARTVHSDDPHALDRYLNAAGSRLFDRETPDGYPDNDTDYADSNAFIQRWKFAHSLRYRLANTVPSHLRSPPTDAKPGSPEHDAWADRLIDLLALRVTGQPLGPRSHQAARTLIERSTTTGYERLKTLGTFIAQTPEASLK